MQLTFQMLKLLPPLVVCQPPCYNEDLHDTSRVTWDKEQEEAELHYYRPVLVYSNHLHVTVKGLVGNKELCTGTIDCTYYESKNSSGKDTELDAAQKLTNEPKNQ